MDIDKILRRQPQTYKTLLGVEYGRNARTVTTSKKLNRAVRDGDILHTYLRGSRFAQILFYHPEKEYDIVMVYDGRDFQHYYCFSVTRYGQTRDFVLGRARMLSPDGSRWGPSRDVRVFCGHVLVRI